MRKNRGQFFYDCNKPDMIKPMVKNIENRAKKNLLNGKNVSAKKLNLHFFAFFCNKKLILLKIWYILSDQWFQTGMIPIIDIYTFFISKIPLRVHLSCSFTMQECRKPKMCGRF
jgi:hypothetical protein